MDLPPQTVKHQRVLADADQVPRRLRWLALAAPLVLGAAAPGCTTSAATRDYPPQTRMITTPIVPSSIRGPQDCFGFVGGPVTICSPSAAHQVYVNHEENKQPKLWLAFHGRQFSSGGNPAVVQALGEPLRPGESVTITGRTRSDSMLDVQAGNVEKYPKAWFIEALYAGNLGLTRGGTLMLRITKHGDWPVVTLRRANGELVAPRVVSQIHHS